MYFVIQFPVMFERVTNIGAMQDLRACTFNKVLLRLNEYEALVGTYESGSTRFFHQKPHEDWAGIGPAPLPREVGD